MVLAALAVGCGGEVPAVVSPRARVVQLSVRYEMPQVGERGRTRASEWRPARRVRFTVLAASNRVALEASTDERGEATVRVPPDARWLEVESRVAEGALAVTSDGLGRQPHRVRVELPDEQNEVALHIGREDDASAPFAALDAMIDGLDAARRWSGRAFPPLFARWVQGEDEVSSYSPLPLGLAGDDRRYQIRLGSDDAYDPSAVLHEVGHFVFHRFGTTSSGGGGHGTQVVVDPGLAWEEGRATWFAAAVHGEGRYVDARGEAPSGTTFAIDLERRDARDAPDRLDSEATVFRVLWDLADGTAGLRDDDDDSIGLDPEKLVHAMDALGSEPDVYPSLSAFLLVLAEREALPPGAIARMLRRTSMPPELWVDRREALWPTLLELGQPRADTLLGLDQPTPDGARARLSRHVIRVRVEEPGLLRLRVSLSRGSRDDLVDAVAARTGTDPSLVAPAVEQLLADSRVRVNVRLAGLDGSTLARWPLSAGEHTLERLVAEPGIYLLTLRQWDLVPAHYELSAELEAL